MEFTPEMRDKLRNAPSSVRDIIMDIMIDGILNSDHPEESKIEVRLLKICRELEGIIHEISDDFATPLPSFESEGRDAQMRAYPARKQCLEYPELVKGGLETFRQQVPAPDIPQKYKNALKNHRDEF